MWRAGTFTGSTRPEGWRVSTRSFAVRNAHANAQADLDLLLPGDASSPILKINSRFQDAVLTEAWRYLPIDKLSEKVLAWLDAAPLAGRAPSGEFVFDGPTRSFPFRNGEGLFRISFPVAGMRLHYAEGWPDLENLAADIEFRNAGLTGVVRSATLNGLRIENSRAQFVDFRTGELTINGRATGDVGDALGYLQKSPLADNLGSLFADLRGKGPVAATVDILLPVKNMEQHKVLVTAQLNQTCSVARRYGAGTGRAARCHPVQRQAAECYGPHRDLSRRAGAHRAFTGGGRRAQTSRQRDPRSRSDPGSGAAPGFRGL